MVTISIADVSAVNVNELSCFAFGICRNANLADDVVQSAICNILERIRRFETIAAENVDAFFKVYVRSALFDILKSEKRRHIEHSDDAVKAFENAATTTNAEIDVIEAIEEIHFNRNERIVISHVIDGKKSPEICEIMDITPENFRKISQRIREKVSESL